MRAAGVRVALGACALLAGACATAPRPAPRSAAEAAENAAVAAGVEATSLLGKPLLTAEPTGEFRQRQEALLAEARERLHAAREDVDAWIWVGRRLGYLGRFRDAIAHYSEAIERFPDVPELYRHRGHRYLSVRELENTRADFERAAVLMASRPDAIEPDGLPNDRNQPTSMLRSNVWYHLALARHLLGDTDGAIAAWDEARRAVDNPDNLVAASYWLYLALAASGDAAGARAVLAPITPDLDVIENHDYHRLLLVFQGSGDAQALLAEAEKAGGLQLATVGYGLAAWHLQRGERDEAARLLREVVDTTPWPSFGHLAAEALLARDAELRRLAGCKGPTNLRARASTRRAAQEAPPALKILTLNRTITIRLDRETAAWVRQAAARIGISAERFIEDQLKQARAAEEQPFMRLAGVMGGPRNLSVRQGFRRQPS